MKKLSEKLRYFGSAYLHQGILNARVLLILVGVYLVLYVGCHGLADRLAQFDVKINPLELVSSMLAARTVYFILFALYLLWLHCLEFREDCQYELIRMGKKMWLLRQYLFAFFTSVLFYLWVVACTAVMVGGQMTLENHWCRLMKFAETLGDLGISFRALIDWRAGGTDTPLKVGAVSLILMILCAACLGMLMMALNLWFQKNVGMLVVLAGVMTTSMFDNSGLYMVFPFLHRCFDFVNPLRVAIPMNRSVLVGLDFSFWYGIAYFICLMVVLWFVGKRIIQNKGGVM